MGTLLLTNRGIVIIHFSKKTNENPDIVFVLKQVLLIKDQAGLIGEAPHVLFSLLLIAQE